MKPKSSDNMKNKFIYFPFNNLAQQIWETSVLID